MFFQITVDAIIVGNVPQLRITLTTTPEVIIYAMQYFVSKQEFNLFGLEHFDEARVVVKISTICCGSGTPSIGIDQFQSSGHVTKEASTKQHAHTGSDQHFANFAINLGISGANEIGKLFC